MTFYIQKVKGHLHCDCFVKKKHLATIHSSEMAT